MDDPPLTSFSVTHVSYNASDPIAYLCAWLALTPQVLVVVYATLIWSNRELEVFLMFAGQMGCEVLNFILKRIIKEERPKQIRSKGYGMPSSHAQFVAFFSLYLTLFLLVRHSPHPSTTHSPTTFTQRVLLCLLSIAFAATVCASRIYLNYHTASQVVVGCVAGVVIGSGWFAITTWARKSGWIEWALDRNALIMLRVRDLVVEEDLAEAGWERWRKVNARRKSNRSEMESAERKLR